MSFEIQPAPVRNGHTLPVDVPRDSGRLAGERASVLRGVSCQAEIVALSRRIRDLLADCSTECTYAARHVLARQGEPLAAVFLISTGYLKVVHGHANGREVLAAVPGPGDIVGGAEALAARPLQATVTTATRVTASVVPAHTLRQRTAEDHELAHALLLFASLKSLEQADLYWPFSGLSARERVEQFLKGLIEQHAPGGDRADFVRLRLPVRQQEIAHFLRITPETFSRTLAALEAEGLLKRHRGTLDIKVES